MSCKKHVQRKRPNSCPDCAAELNKSKPVEKTSREMLADLNAMEKEADDLVIKPVKAKKHVIKTVITEEDIEKPSEAVEHLATQFGVARKELDDLIDVFFHAKIEEINSYFDDKVKQYKALISGLANIRYENLYVPLDVFDVKLMEKLNKEKWRLINFWDANIAKASGIKKEVAVLERIVAPDNKPRPEYKL